METKMKPITSALVALYLIPNTVSAQDFDAAEVYSQLVSQIQARLGFSEGPKNGGDYLSLAATSEVVIAGDAAKVNNMADFVPPERPIVTSFNTYPKLSTVYEFVFNSLTGP